METIENNQTEFEFPTFMLTRSLYSKLDVKQSLMISLFEHNHEESLFWTYELYYSGFQEEVFEFIVKIYENIYMCYNEKLAEFILELVETWFTEKNDSIIGTIVMTLSKREYNLDEFIKMYYEYECNTVKLEEKGKRKFKIIIDESKIEQYKTDTIDDSTEMTPWSKFGRICRYPIRTNVRHLFQTYVPNDLKIIYSSIDNWLYYAAKSPIWKKRIEENGGKINEFTKKVEFENDINKEDFYEKWDYDIDEQPIHLRNNVMGDFEERQLSLDDFVVQYGFGCIHHSDCHDTNTNTKNNTINTNIDNDYREPEKKNENITTKVSDLQIHQENKENTKQKTLFSFYKKSESPMTNSIVYT